MNNYERNFDAVPAAACQMVVGEPELGDNGGGAKTAPVRLVARSGKPIEHWFWGRVVHDLAGMHLHKPRLPIDYVHDSGDIIGFLNHFDTKTGDLVATGALVPFKESDRATEVMHKAKAGVPYEASINFGGDGIRYEEIAEGQVTQVNGYSFEGPGIVIREWPLRGVAICPYGADAHTESAVLASGSKQTFVAARVTAAATVKEAAMSEPTVEAVAPVVAAQPSETAKIEEPKAVEASQPAEAKPVEVAPAAVEPAPAVEAAQPAEAKPEEKKPEAPALSRDEFLKIADKFGDAIAVQTVRQGGDYAAAMELAYTAKCKETETLRAAAAQGKPAGGQPVPLVEAKTPAKLFNTGK